MLLPSLVLKGAALQHADASQQLLSTTVRCRSYALVQAAHAHLARRLPRSWLCRPLSGCLPRLRAAQAAERVESQPHADSARQAPFPCHLALHAQQQRRRNSGQHARRLPPRHAGGGKPRASPGLCPGASTLEAAEGAERGGTLRFTPAVSL